MRQDKGPRATYYALKEKTVELVILYMGENECSIWSIEKFTHAKNNSTLVELNPLLHLFAL